jgi:tRNA A37 threonylcarbamoyladenosine dehydratase
MSDMFERTKALINDADFNKIHSARILIAGLGGVGGYALETLLRLGVGNFLLIDFDNIDITNLNRQILTLQNNVGKAKIDAAKDRAALINPQAKIQTLNLKINQDNIKNILSEYTPNFVIDAVDDVNAKFAIIKTCEKMNIPAISSMGAALRYDIDKIKIGTINSASQYCPLARKLNKLCKSENINLKSVCVYSSEMPQKKSGQYLGSLSFVTAAFGISLSAYFFKQTVNK